MNYRVVIQNTRFGPITANVHELDQGFTASISHREYPDLPAHGPLPGEPLAASIDDAIEQLRRALTR